MNRLTKIALISAAGLLIIGTSISYSADLPPSPASNGQTLDLELVKHLSDLRKELDARSVALDKREALAAATEKKLQDKLIELQGIREQINTQMKTITGKAKEEIEKLCRIYEAMKPKDAASVFEALEMPTLLDIVDECMKESKAAAILQQMDPIKVRDMSTALVQRRRFPSSCKNNDAVEVH